MTMGLGGGGNITLAEGLVDVDVTFNVPKRARWSCSKTKVADRDGTSGPHSAGGAGRRAGGRRWTNSGWDSSEAEGSDSGSEVSVRHGVAGSGGGAVSLGDRIRIYWTGEEVWFRCDVRKVFAGTDDVEVEYLVEGWPLGGAGRRAGRGSDDGMEQAGWDDDFGIIELRVEDVISEFPRGYKRRKDTR